MSVPFSIVSFWKLRSCWVDALFLHPTSGRVDPPRGAMPPPWSQTKSPVGNVWYQSLSPISLVWNKLNSFSICIIEELESFLWQLSCKHYKWQWMHKLLIAVALSQHHTTLIRVLMSCVLAAISSCTGLMNQISWNYHVVLRVWLVMSNIFPVFFW